MKVRLLVYGEMINPDFSPPEVDPNSDASRTAYQVYRATVPQSIPAPPGLVVEAHNAWRHCLPDGSGEAARSIPGRILAEPWDDEAKVVVAAKIAEMSPEKKRWYDLAIKRQQREIAEISPEKRAPATDTEG